MSYTLSLTMTRSVITEFSPLPIYGEFLKINEKAMLLISTMKEGSL